MPSAIVFCWYLVYHNMNRIQMLLNEVGKEHTKLCKNKVVLERQTEKTTLCNNSEQFSMCHCYLDNFVTGTLQITQNLWARSWHHYSRWKTASRGSSPTEASRLPDLQSQAKVSQSGCHGADNLRTHRRAVRFCSKGTQQIWRNIFQQPSGEGVEGQGEML